MRVTVINSDKAIGIAGEFFTNLSFTLDPEIHAIQWYDTWGEVEYVITLVNGRPFKPENTVITDFTPYEPLVAVWQQAKDAQLAAIAEAIAKEAAEAAAQTQETPTP